MSVLRNDTIFETLFSFEENRESGNKVKLLYLLNLKVSGLKNASDLANIDNGSKFKKMRNSADEDGGCGGIVCTREIATQSG